MTDKNKMRLDKENGKPASSKNDHSKMKECLSKTILVFSQLYPQDARIIVLELQGKDRKEIADKIGVAENTLEKEMTGKYGIVNRFEKLFKELLRNENNIDIDIIGEDLKKYLS